MRRTVLAVAGLLALGACGGDDVVGIHITLRATGGGVLTTQSLQVPDSPGPAEGGVTSVEWQERVNLFASKGSFERLSDVGIGEITFTLEARHLTILIPRGPDVSWYRTLAPTTEAQQRQAATTYDPTGKTKSVGTMIQFQIELPGEAVAVGIAPGNVRGVSTDKDKNKVSAVLPVSAMRQSGEPLRWEVTWR